MNRWLKRFIQTADSFINYEWVTESLTQPIHLNGWLIHKLWMGHWIIDSKDSFKRLIHL